MRRAFVMLVAAVTILATASVAFAQPRDPRPDNAQGPKGQVPPEKVDVCHQSEEGEFHLINVSERALEAHLNHGDAIPGEAVPGQEGYEFIEECEIIYTETIELTAARVFANGGVYENPDVEAAIENGLMGTVVMTRAAEAYDLEFDFSFENLNPGETYTVYLDGDGGAPGTWVALGTFVAEPDGTGSFEYDVTLAAGDYFWSFWVNQSTPPASVLQTVTDFEFTLP